MKTTLTINLMALMVASRVLGFEDTALRAGDSLSAIHDADAADRTGSANATEHVASSKALIADAAKLVGRATKRKAGASGKRIKGVDTDIPNVRRIQGKQMVRVVAMRRQRNGKLELIASTPIRQTEDLPGTMRFQRGRGYFGKQGTAPDGIKAKIQAAYEAGSLVWQLLDHVTGKVLLPTKEKAS